MDLYAPMVNNATNTASSIYDGSMLDARLSELHRSTPVDGTGGVSSTMAARHSRASGSKVSYISPADDFADSLISLLIANKLRDTRRSLFQRKRSLKVIVLGVSVSST